MLSRCTSRIAQDTDDPDQALGVLEHATTIIDPRAEHLYRATIALHRRHAAAARALATLTDRLAEIDAQPHPTTIALAAKTVVSRL